jgi:2Fe-2S ferredoxin
MPLVKYVNFDGTTNEIDVPVGDSVMQGAVDNMLDGIIAECGGSCSCATCHCYVDQDWLDKIPPASEMEKDMLECVLEPQDNSRLSCQIKISDDMDGLIIRLPESQF